MGKTVQSQAEKVRAKLLLQKERLADIILKKFKPKENSREIHLTEMEWALYHRASASPVLNEYQEDQLEWLDERLQKLSKNQMRLIRLYFWEGKTMEEIGKLLKKSKMTISNYLKESLNVLREG